MSEADDWEILKLLLEQTENESDRYWTRMNIFVTIMGAMFAGIVIFSEQINPILMILISLFGLSISLAWFQVARMSKFYANRWRKDAAALLESNEELLVKIKAINEPRVRKPKLAISSTQCIKFLSVIVMILWGALMAYAIYLYFKG